MLLYEDVWDAAALGPAEDSDNIAVLVPSAKATSLL